MTTLFTNSLIILKDFCCFLLSDEKNEQASVFHSIIKENGYIANKKRQIPISAKARSRYLSL